MKEKCVELSRCKNIILKNVIYDDKCVPVTTARHILRLRMEERPPDMEGSCEYIE
jgi:hypothetical protein